MLRPAANAPVVEVLAARRVTRNDWLLFALAALFVARFVYMAFEA